MLRFCQEARGRFALDWALFSGTCVQSLHNTVYRWTNVRWKGCTGFCRLLFTAKDIYLLKPTLTLQWTGVHFVFPSRAGILLRLLFPREREIYASCGGNCELLSTEWLSSCNGRHEQQRNGWSWSNSLGRTADQEGAQNTGVFVTRHFAFMWSRGRGQAVITSGNEMWFS